ncbi:MAG: hypothetical protein JWO19_564 [Bryobacterales bacterium]|nr:hypothetical protein [Bryobacterales bacterium]
MLKKLSTLLFLCALCMWAADFWTTKPFTEWNEKEVTKILNDSPWVQKVTITTGGGGSGGGFGDTGGKGAGGRGGGRGGGPQGDSVNSDPGIDGSGGGGFGAGPSGVSVSLLWQTALPVRQALAKRRFGAEAGTSPEAKAALDRVDPFYVLTLIGMPGSALAAAQGDKKVALVESTTLTVNGKPPLKATDVQISGGRGTAAVSFLFPKTTTFTVEDKEMEFSSRFDKISVKKKFKLKDMVFNGKVEM